MGAFRTLPQPRCCYAKLKLTPEEAAARFDRYQDENTNIFICEACGWLHFGHEPVRLRKAAHYAILEYKESRHRARQKKQLRIPAWMLDNRRDFVQKMDIRRIA